MAERAGKGGGKGDPHPPPGRSRLISLLRAGCPSSAGGSLPPGARLSDHGADLLARLLDPNPLTRLCAANALAHPFFTDEAPSPGEDTICARGEAGGGLPSAPAVVGDDGWG